MQEFQFLIMVCKEINESSIYLSVCIHLSNIYIQSIRELHIKPHTRKKKTK